MNAQDPDNSNTRLGSAAGGAENASDAYLWDGAGEPDADFAAMERVLSPLRWKPTPFAADEPRSVAGRIDFVCSAPLRAAAAFALLIAGAWAVSIFTNVYHFSGVHEDGGGRLAASGSMNVIAMNGSPLVAGEVIGENASIRPGEWLETDSASTAQITVGAYGTVKVEPDSRMRLIAAKPLEQRLELAKGSMSAFINAPPRLFIVDTPAATAFDLGCSYRMNVDDEGNGEIEVTLGWVSMENHGVESIVPYGAKCVTRKTKRVGTPFFGDASAAFIEALARFDFENGGDTAVDVILNEAVERDSLTLWHLLARTEGETRGRVFDRLAMLLSPPASVSRDAIMRGDANAMNAWREDMVWAPLMPTVRSK